MDKAKIVDALERKIKHAKNEDGDFVFLPVWQARQIAEYLKPMKPVRTVLGYVCGRCGSRLNYSVNLQQYCDQCGQIIDWEGEKLNNLHIIGNLTADPELRTTSGGKEVCTFTVAVNHRKDDGADFFRVSAWNERGKVCKQYLTKGKKVSVIGPVSVRLYTKSNGDAAASLEVMADDVEFLSPNER